MGILVDFTICFLNPVFYFYTFKSSECRICETKVAPYVPSYCFFYYGEISKTREIGRKNLDFGLLIDSFLGFHQK